MDHYEKWVSELRSLIQTRGDIIGWLESTLPRLSPYDLIRKNGSEKGCNCDICHREQFELFKQVFSLVPPDKVIAIVVDLINKHIGSESLPSLFQSFFAFSAWKDGKYEYPLMLYKFVSFDNPAAVEIIRGMIKDRSDMEDFKKAHQSLGEIDNNFGELNGIGVREDAIKELESFCVSEYVIPGVSGYEIFLQDKKPVIDRTLPFDDRFRQFVDRGHYKFVRTYFDPVLDGDRLIEKMVSGKCHPDIANYFPKGRRHRAWKRVYRKYLEKKSKRDKSV